MIHFDPATRTFNLILKHSYYAFQVDAKEQLVHLGWGPRPDGATERDLISGAVPYETYTSNVSFETQIRPDEVLTYGDVTLYGVTLKATFASLPMQPEAHEDLHLPIRDLRLRYVSHDVVNDARPGLAPAHGLPVQATTTRQTLRIHLQDPIYPFRVSLCYRLTPEYDIIERWCELENIGEVAVTIEECQFASLYLPNGTNQLTYVSGAWAREFTTQREQLPMGTHVIESRTVQTGHFTNPFFLLNRPGQAWEEHGTVYFGHLAYSGSWRIALEQLPTWDVRVHGGYNTFEFELQLAPGERHVTPAFVCGVSRNGWGGASRRMHTFTRDYVLPCPARAEGEKNLRPVLYNSWEATYFDLSFENQVELARKAAAIGVELFCVDDGWFGGRRHDRAGLGDWVVSPDVFPEGMEPLVEEIHRLGMKFGLWVEPEMVNPDSELYRRHPEWVLHFPGRGRTEVRSQLVLDFGRQEVIDYLFEALDQLVERYDVAFFKWDMNRSVSEPGSVVGKAIWRKHVAGVYALMDRLRRKHPGLDIQSCSGGGGRIDLGVFGRTDQAWVSDNTDALDRIRIQEGYSLMYPARCMEAWVTHEHNHITHRVTPLNVRFDVAMRGALGIGSSLNELDEAELDEYASYIAFYKRIRHIIQEGELYRLERLEEFGASVIQYVLPNGREAVFSLAVHNYQVGSFRPAALLKGLHPAAAYAVFDRHEREIHRASGYELMTLGIPYETRGYPAYSHTYHIKQI